MSNVNLSDVADDAADMVNVFVEQHHAAAIPALIGACVLWAVEHGGADVVIASLKNAQKLAKDMERDFRAVRQ